MDTFATIDAKILLLERELHDLRTRRNALTSIGRLPAELLALIFTMLQQPSTPLYPSEVAYMPLVYRKWTCVMAVCRHFRAVALGTTELWTRIDCNAPDTWHALCSTLSKSKPLIIQANTKPGMSRSDVVYIEEVAALYLQKARAAYFNMHCDDSGKPITGQLLQVINTHAPFIEDFRFNTELSFRLTHKFLGGTCHTLRRLHLYKTLIYGCPYLPNLDTLELNTFAFKHSTDPQAIVNLSHLLNRMPSIVALSIVCLLAPEDDESYLPMPDFLPQIRLPNLRSLHLEVRIQHMKALLQALSEPSQTLKIILLATKASRWSTPPTDDHMEIINHLSAFWQNKTGKDHLPSGKIWSVRFESTKNAPGPEPTNFMTFGNRKDPPAGTPGVAYECHSTVTQFHPVVGHIRTFLMTGDRVGPSCSEMDTGAEYLADLDEVGLEDFKTAKHLDAVEKWLKKRHARGLATKSIEFADYRGKIAAKVDALAERLERAGLVDRVLRNPNGQLVTGNTS